MIMSYKTARGKSTGIPNPYVKVTNTMFRMAEYFT